MNKQQKEMILQTLLQLGCAYPDGRRWPTKLRKDFDKCVKLLDPACKKVVVKKDNCISRKY
jgi:arabinogalactan endo-1,4-beta-galactosidase